MGVVCKSPEVRRDLGMKVLNFDILGLQLVPWVNTRYLERMYCAPYTL